MWRIELVHCIALVYNERHMDKNIKDILESLDFLKENMVTKSDFAELQVELREIRADIRDIRQQLDALTETIGGMKGYAQEIDELRSRVNTLETELREIKLAA